MSTTRSTPSSRGSEDPRPVDFTVFADVVAAALTAFACDASYAVAIARAATAIHEKRDMASARRELRAAEALAQAECSQVSFPCHAVGPCGAADCKFAPGDLSQLTVTALPGQSRRPQASSRGDYSIESAVAPLVELRRIAF